MDLYAVLGLAPGASIADIKRAYRRLARRYHPGINPGDRAVEALFHRITEAYETLVDPARREKYDTGGHGPSAGGAAQSFEFAGFDFTVAAHGAQAATFTELFADVLHPVSPADAGKPEAGRICTRRWRSPSWTPMRGVQRQVVVTRQEICPACRGSGSVSTPEARCVPCHGSGSVRWARGHMLFSKPCAGVCRHRTAASSALRHLRRAGTRRADRGHFNGGASRDGRRHAAADCREGTCRPAGWPDR